MQDLVQIILLTELGGEGQASEILCPLPIDRVDIEPDHKRGKETDEDHEGDYDHRSFAILVHSAKGDVGQKGKRKQEAAQKAKYVRNIVNPWQEATNKEEEDNSREVQESFPGFL